MENNPKRRKSKDNPYTIYIIDNKYIVEFKDGRGVIQKVDVSKEVYESFDSFELIDKSQMTKIEKHIASYDLSEEYINKHKIDEEISMDDEIIMKANFQELREAIEQLPKIQRRRIKMHYFNEMTQQQIADFEAVDIRAIQYSLQIALKNLKKNKKIQK